MQFVILRLLISTGCIVFVRACRLEKYLNLVQLFKLDDLLPRTLLATAKLNRVVELARTMCFPPDALMANLCYWLKVDTNARNDGVC
jgi:hypothetical protein